MSAYLNLDEPALRARATRAVEQALARGARQVHAIVGETGGCRATARDGRYETLVGDNAAFLHLRVFRDGRQATATAATLTDTAIAQVAGKAVDLLPMSGVDPLHGLPDRDLLAWDAPIPDIYRPAALTPPDIVARAAAIEGGARGEGAAIGVESASFSSHDMQMAIATSDGFLRGYRHSFHRGSCNANARTAAGLQGAVWWSGSRALDATAEPAAIGATAAQRALARCDPRGMAGGTMPVLFAADVAEELIGHLVAALAGDAQYRRATFLAKSIGRAVLPDHVDIVEAPHLPLAPASMPFDNEGVAARDRHVVANGRIEGYFLSTYSGRKLGMASTGNANGPTNLVVTSARTDGGDDTEAMLRRLGTGLFVTETMGQGVNLTNGDYSRAVAGFRVERGAIVSPVEGITVAGNLADMYAGIVAIGADALHRGQIDTGSILIDAMRVAGR